MILWRQKNRRGEKHDMSNNELLLAISGMMDKKLEPIQKDISQMKNDIVNMKKDISNIQDDIIDIKGQIKEMDVRINEVDVRIKQIEINQENKILPRLQNIEACYTSTYERYARGADQIENTMQDMSLIKTVVTEHSAKLEKIS